MRPAIAQMTAPHTEGPDLSREALETLIRRIGFGDAIMRVSERLVREYQSSWALNRILSDRGRMVAAFVALDLYFADASRRGFTLAQLRGEAARHGFASPGRVTAWAASLRLLGLFAAGAPDRPQRLAPTTKFIAVFRTRMSNMWRSIALIHPRADRAVAALEQDAFLAHLCAGFMGPYLSGQRVLHSIPELTEVAEREAGMVLLMSMMLKDAAGEPITIAGLSREFVISRAHVRSILGAAAEAGLVDRPEADSAYRVRPGLAEGLSRLFAALFQVHIFAMDRALSRLDGENPDRVSGSP